MALKVSNKAERMSKFIERLTLWEGQWAGQPFRLSDFQQEIIDQIYGPVDSEGKRLVQTACIWLPRGCGKTALAAAISLAHFMGPEAEPGGQIVMAAADRSNASIAFNHAWQMARRDPELLKRIDPLESRKLLRHPGTTSTLQAISSEAYSKNGLNCSFFLADEVHAWQESEARQLWAAITDSQIKRVNPLTILISTAGYGQGGLAYDLWETSKQIASGELVDPTWMVYIASMPEGLELSERSSWNFHPGVRAGFVDVDNILGKFRLAQGSPSDVASLMQFHANRWREGAANPWIDIGTYDKVEPQSELAGRECWMGVDLSAVNDLTAVALVFPSVGEDGKRRWDVQSHFWLPEQTIGRKSDLDKANYLRWAQEGWMTLTEGDVIDHNVVYEWILEQMSEYNVVEVSIDRALATWLNTQLLEKGISVVQYGQGMLSMAAPVREIKRAIMDGHFRHGGNPVMRMCFANVTAEIDASENEKFTKSRSRGRIDGAVASAMAIGRALSKEQSTDNWDMGVWFV